MTTLMSHPVPRVPHAWRLAPATSRVTHLRVVGDHGGRFLQVIDLENMVGGYATPQYVRRFVKWYAAAGLTRPGDMCIAAVSRRFATSLFEVPEGWLRRVAGNEKDAADRMLLDDSPTEWVASRFDGLVIASGDGAFADLATGCREAGLRVTTVRGKGAMSTALHLAGQEHVWVPARVLARMA